MEHISDKNRNIDYIATCTSSWHFTSVLGFLTGLKAKSDRDLEGIIYICRHENGKLMIDEKLLSLPSGLGVHFCYSTDEIICCLDSYKKNKTDFKTLYVISPFAAWTKMCLRCKILYRRNIECIVVDEGIGSYKSFSEILRELYGCHSHPYRFSLFVLKYVSSKVIPILTGVKVTKINMLVWNGSCLVPDRKTVENMRNAVRCFKLEEIQICESGKYAVLITDPADENGFSDSESEEVMKCYKQFEKTCSERGVRLYVKPHPREGEDIYRTEGFRVIRHRLSIEQMIVSAERKPEFVCGLNSTGLITVKILFNIKAVSLNNRLIQNYKIKSHAAMENLNHFSERYGRIVEILQ